VLQLAEELPKSWDEDLAYLEDIAEVRVLSVRQILKSMSIIIVHCLLNTGLRQLVLLPVVAK
jgi:hypothetical protein